MKNELIERMKNDGILDPQNNELEKVFDEIFNKQLEETNKN